MEGIARKFFADDSMLQLEMGPDGKIGFLATNYIEILGIYRAISKQNHLTALKKENAQDELNALRLKQAQFQKKPKQIKDEDWKELNSKMEYWKGIREEKDIVYFRGKPVRRNSCVEFLMKYTSLVEALSILDAAARQPIGRGAEYLTRVATWPLKKVILFTVMCLGAKGASKDIGAAIYAIVDSLPYDIEDRIANVDPGLTSGSNSPDYDELKLIEVKVAH